MPVVRLLIANALGKDTQPGNQILYSLKTGACAVSPKDDIQLDCQFELHKSLRRLKQSMAGELTGTARDRDTVSAIEMTKIDARIGQITAGIKSLLNGR